MFFLFVVFISCNGNKSDNSLKNEVAESETTSEIDPDSGLVKDYGLNLVITNCTGCHSAKLIQQNRATREGWTSMIRWMQQTQNLWDLGPNETAIIDYLTRNYAPVQSGRRKNLENIEWYNLEE